MQYALIWFWSPSDDPQVVDPVDDVEDGECGGEADSRGHVNEQRLVALPLLHVVLASAAAEKILVFCLYPKEYVQ